MTTRRVVGSVIVVLMLGSPARGQTSSTAKIDGSAAQYLDPVDGLSLEVALAQALAREPALAASRTEIDAARGMRLQAGLRPNPTVSFLQQFEPGGMDNQTRIEALWPLDLFRKAGRVGVADREIEIALHQVADRERLLAAEVRARYGDAAVAVRELSVLDQVYASASRQLELVAARVDAGAMPPLERDILRVEIRRLESERVLKTGTVEQAMIRLKRLLGVAPDASLKLRDALEDLVQREGATLVTETLGVQTRPDVEVATARVALADAQIDRAKRQGRVDASVSGMYMGMDAGFPQQAFGAGGGLEPIRGVFHYLGVGFSVSLPLGDRNQGQVAAAQAARAGAIAQLQATEANALSEFGAARARDTRARQALALYTGDMRTLASQNLTVVSQTYELGRATVFDVLAEQRRFLDIEGAYTGVLREAYEARQALRRELGEGR